MFPCPSTPYQTDPSSSSVWWRLPKWLPHACPCSTLVSPSKSSLETMSFQPWWACLCLKLLCNTPVLLNEPMVLTSGPGPHGMSYLPHPTTLFPAIFFPCSLCFGPDDLLLYVPLPSRAHDRRSFPLPEVLMSTLHMTGCSSLGFRPNITSPDILI